MLGLAHALGRPSLPFVDHRVYVDRILAFTYASHPLDHANKNVKPSNVEGPKPFHLSCIKHFQSSRLTCNATSHPHDLKASRNSSLPHQISPWLEPQLEECTCQLRFSREQHEGSQYEIAEFFSAPQEHSNICMFGAASIQRMVPMAAQSAIADLSAVPFLEALNLDPRPTIILDLQAERRGLLQPVFANLAVKNTPGLFDSLVSEEIEFPAPAGSFAKFFAWLRPSVHDDSRTEPSFWPTALLGLNWMTYTLGNRWKIVSATRDGTPSSKPQATRIEDGPVDFVTSVISPGQTEATSLNSESRHPLPRSDKFVDRPGPSTAIAESPASLPGSQNVIETSTASARLLGSSPYIEFIKKFNWASTLIGPIDSWPDQLVQMCNLIFSSPQPAIIFWSQDFVLIYNEAAAQLVSTHPFAMGLRVQDFSPEMWEVFVQPVFATIMKTGKAFCGNNNLVNIMKDGIFEERFFNSTYLPLTEGSSGHVVGICEFFYEVTRDSIAQRRTASLLELNAFMSPAKNLNMIWSSIIDGLKENSHDIAQLLVYSITGELENGVSSSKIQNVQRCVLECSVGYRPAVSPSVRENFDLMNDTTDLSNSFRRAMEADRPVHIKKEDEALPADFWNAFEPRGCGDPCRSIAIVPLRPTSRDIVIGLLVIGLNPRLAFDDYYEKFVNLLQRQISSSAAATLLLEDEVSREKKVAEQTAHQLRLRLKEAEAHELRFTRFAKHAPIGICTYGPDGSMVFANEFWYNLTKFPRDGDTKGLTWWKNLVFPEDLQQMEIYFTCLLLESNPVAFEIRLKQSVVDDDQYIWVLCSAYPDPTKQGFERIVACFTDISEQKGVEELQKRRLEDVIEAKRQQENFIDTTSHEIRNPLSVVLQCGEEIIGVCTEALKRASLETHVTMSSETLRSTLDAAETIEVCTLHQKRIVDDILNLSKMDSGLLPITPDNAQPLSIAESILKVFNRDFSVSDIETHFHCEDSFYKQGLDWAQFDPSRFSQMIINLTSNALKFTKTETHRRIEFQVGASTDDSEASQTWPLEYLARTKTVNDSTLGFDWLAKDCVNLHFKVRDSGRGMTKDEQQRLFSRFFQASPLTHVQYGGSGLGLYICRALAEMHGGQIGFTSTAGKGSIFGFYIKVRRYSPSAADIAKKMATQVLSIASPSRSSSISSFSKATGSIDPEPTPMAEVVTSSGAIPNTTKFSIMIVEDNLVNQKVLRRQLEKLGHTIMVANNGQEALRLLRTTRFWKGNEQGSDISVILMDIEMPVMDGVSCAQIIRNLQLQGLITAHVPIIAITGNAREEKVAIAKGAGMDEVVLKPFKVPMLIPLIAKLRKKYIEGWNESQK